jgi:hypothetical protein
MTVPQQTQTREVGPLSTRADIVPSSIDDKARTVDVVWTTGAPVLRHSWFDGSFYEELSLDPKHVRMERFESGRAPTLIAHDSWDPDSHVGVILSAKLERNQGTATVRFAENDADADKAWNKIRQGILTSVSVGYRIHKMEKVEGGDEQIPTYRATDWEPYEVSFVSMPADPGAHARSAPQQRTNPCQIITNTRASVAREEQRMTDEEKTAAEAKRQAKEAKRQAQLKEERDAGAKAERERMTEIRAAVAKVGLGAELADKLVADGVSLSKARVAVIDAMAERQAKAGGPSLTPSGVRIAAGEDERDKRQRGMAAALFERAGATPTIDKAKKHSVFGSKFADVATDGGEFRGLSLVDIARSFLERAGVSTRGMDRMTLVGAAFAQRSPGYQGTSDFALLLENVVGKMLLGAYAIASDSWRTWIKTETVSDFRPSFRYRTGSMAGGLDDLNEHGEYKNKSLPDGQRFSISTGTKGNIIALTRQLVINDDMGALADVATKFGRSAALGIEIEAYKMLAANSGLGPTMSDGKTFFHADRGNICTPSAVSSVAGWDADRVKFAQLKDQSNNEFLDLRPSILVLPVGLGAAARLVNTSQFDTSDATAKFQKPNVALGLFGQIVDTPRLDGTRRYLFVDPNQVAAFVIAFLEGSGEAPVMESQDGWRVDGTEWRIRMDYKLQPFDPKGAMTNAGA